jgi:hypothetical protein
MVCESFEAIWEHICRLQGQKFRTKTGVPFTYSVESGTTVWVERDGRRINQSLTKSNFAQVYSMMKDGPIDGPAEINQRAMKRGESQVRGPSYVWAILDDNRVIP